MPGIRHLPAELSSFVGREAELAAIGAAVGPGRLITLTGPGGCGKTRLAIRVCGDGGVWVALEDEPSQVAERVAAALDLMLPAGADPVSALVQALRERELLLVLDNCEHVLDEAAALASALVAQCPGISLLATSRAALGIAGERVWAVPPMDLADALALFCERAGVDSDRTGARRVCDRLDRLPLALELAAGWADTLSPAQIADSLQDPYQLLDGGARTGPFRQRTLEGSMRWSHDLLDDAERVLFRRLGVFEPGFTADEVAELSDRPVLKALRGLIAKSLLVSDTSGPVARYRMLGVIRDYALARLAEAGETEQVRSRHLGIQLALVDRLAPLLDSDKDEWRARIGPSYSNIRAAIEWGLAGPEPTLARRLAAGVAWLWHLEGRGDDGIRLLRLAVQHGDGERSALQARVLVSLALVADTALPGGEGYESARQAAELASEQVAEPTTGRLARSLSAIGLISSDLEQARSAAAEVRDEARRAGDGFVADASAALVGLVHMLRDEYRAAIEQLEPAIDGLLSPADRGVGSSALCWLAQATGRAGDLRRAAELAERAVATAEPLRDFHRVGSARAVLAETLVQQGDPDAAVEALGPIDRLVAGLDRSPFIPGWERTHARLDLARGAPENAVDWCRREPPGAPDSALTPETQLVLAIAVRESGEDPTELLQGLASSPIAQQMPRLRAAVLSEQAAGADTERALDLQHEALRIRVDHDLTLDCIDSLDALARLYLRRGTAAPAALLFGAAETARTTAGAGPAYKRPDGLDPQLIERGRTMTLREAAGYAARSRGRRRRPDSGWDSLTPTERSVVDLAVQGLSNPDIAARLFVTRGTVKTHLAHVYAKLQVANRTELTRLAGEQD